MSHLIANDAAQFRINLLLILTVADTTEIKIRAVADVKLIII